MLDVREFCNHVLPKGDFIYSCWNGIVRVLEWNSESENTQTTGEGHGCRFDTGNAFTKPEEEFCLFNKVKD